jgi:LPPG:FO 2-phospho-L-lactate transferase
MNEKRQVREHVVLLVGGVGGAKLALGLSKVLPPQALTIIVNTSDDFEHLGLYISPDLDTVMYTLADLANPDTGWGVDDDTFRAMEMVTRYGGPDWFRLGDRDLGTNLLRTTMLRDGNTLTVVTRHLCTALGIRHAVLPMSDQPVRTWLDTDRGELAFQEYFVRERWQPVVSRIRFVGAEEAYPAEGVIDALQSATLIVFGPSNPLLSIDPILAVPGIRAHIAGSRAPCVAVSPIIGGQAVKGPAAKLLAELGMDVSPLGIAKYYEDLLKGIILDEADRLLCKEIEALGIRASAQQILMKTLPDKIRLAEILLHWSEENLL